MDQSEVAPTGRKPATIYDVAEATGFNASTVSRALNKPGRINAQTEKKIQDAAEEIGYRHNPIARALLTGRTSTLAIVLSDITNPVYFDLLRGAERACSINGYTLVFAESQESPEIELATAKRLELSVDGIVLVASRMSDDQVKQLAVDKPVVLVNREIGGVLSVVPDVRPGLSAALDDLAAAGHSSVGYLAGPPASWMNRLRWESMFELAIDRQLSIVEIPSGDPTVAGGQGAMRRVKASGVTALVTYNDLMAMGLMLAAKEAGWTIPGDLSVVGFDDIFGADLFTPSLSTVRSPLGDVGHAAVREILGSLSVKSDLLESGLVTEYVPRNSTGPMTPR